MAELAIQMLGAPVLRQKAEEIGEIDDELRLLIADMFDTMYAAEGIGLAANQIGVARRVIVVDVKEDGPGPIVVINPRIVESSRETEKSEEGCLSIPGVSALVERPLTVTVEGLDREGQPIRIDADGLLARCFQHEVDHLEGTLFIDRLSALKRSMLLRKYRSLAEEESTTGKEKASARSSG